MEQNAWLPVSEADFPLSTDSVLLADFAPLRDGQHVFDLGAGSGTLGILLCARNPGIRAEGIELRPSAAAAAAQAFARCGLSERASVTQGDLRQIETLFPGGRQDLVISNPPYYPCDSGAVSADPERAAARTEQFCTPDELCRAAAWLLRWGGVFCLVHKPERLAELMETLRRHRLEPKRLRLVCARADSAPSLFLLEAKKGGGTGLRILPQLVLYDADGGESAEYRRIYGLGR